GSMVAVGDVPADDGPGREPCGTLAPDDRVEHGRGLPAEPPRAPVRQPLSARADAPGGAARPALERDRRRGRRAVRRDGLARPRVVRGGTADPIHAGGARQRLPPLSGGPPPPRPGLPL